MRHTGNWGSWCGAAVWALLAASPGRAEDPNALGWSRQIGTSSWDVGWGVAVDGAGNAYINGYTEGSLGGVNAGGGDAFLKKYDASGTLLWSRQIGTSGTDSSYGQATDSAGNAYLSGYTTGNLGADNAGGADAFLRKYDGAGNLLWSRQLGTLGWDVSYGVAASGAGSVYVSGQTNGNLGGNSAGSQDVFLGKYDGAGSLLWTRQLGTPGVDVNCGVAADGAGNAYISGYTEGNLGGLNAGAYDAFLSKYDGAGNLQWTRQLSTSGYDYGYGVAVDGAGNAYISGTTGGSLGGPNAGGYDAFLSKYDGAGNLLWSRQWGTSSSDGSHGVAVDGADNVYIGGYTNDSLGGPSAGNYDAFLSKYDSAGNLLWSCQLGTGGWDETNGIAVDGAGNAYLCGFTDGGLGGPNAGWTDGFLVKYEATEVPEPSTLGVLGLGGLALGRRRTRRGGVGEPCPR